MWSVCWIMDCFELTCQNVWEGDRGLRGVGLPIPEGAQNKTKQNKIKNSFQGKSQKNKDNKKVKGQVKYAISSPSFFSCSSPWKLK